MPPENNAHLTRILKYMAGNQDSNIGAVCVGVALRFPSLSSANHSNIS